MESIILKAQSHHSDHITVISRTLEVSKAGNIDIELQIGQINIQVRKDSCIYDLTEIYRLKNELRTIESKMKINQ